MPHVPQALSTLVPYMASSLHALMPHALHAVMPSVPCTPHTLLPYCFLCALVPHSLCASHALAPCVFCCPLCLMPHSPWAMGVLTFYAPFFVMYK